MVLDSKGRIVAAGSAWNGASYDIALYRWLP